MGSPRYTVDGSAERFAFDELGEMSACDERAILALAPGESHLVGGGASPECRVLRIHPEALGYPLTENQKAFIRAAKRRGLEVDYTYSGRCMFGARCPSVTLDRGEVFQPRAQHSRDSLGLGSVVYAPY